MTLRSPASWIQGGSHSAENDRLTERSHISAAGIVGTNDLAVSANGTPNMSVNVAAGSAYVAGSLTTTQGYYKVYNDATVNLSVAAADATNPRIDLVVLQIEDAQYSGANNDALLKVVTGTPAASPSAPAAPANSYVLAQIQVAANATSITSGNITDKRTRAVSKPVVMQADTTTAVPLIVKATAAQTSNLQEWQDSTGTAKGTLTPQGTITLAQGILAGSFNFSGITYAGVSAPSGAGSLPNFVVAQGGSGDLTQFRNGGNTVVAYVNAAGNVAGTGAYTTLSDASAKQNVRDLHLDAVDVVRRLRPVHYDYIDGEADQVGFIAQDVQEVLPHAVVPFSGSADDDDDRLGLRDSAILAYVVAAVQTLLTDKAK